MDSLLELLKNMDIDSLVDTLVPDLSSVLGRVELVLRIAVMAGPLMLLGFGLVFLLAPPKEANYGLGYRFWWGMASLEAWQFTQRVAGMAWTGLGTVLSIVMSVMCNGMRGMEIMDMVWRAVKCLCWELGLLVLACLVINGIVVARFDHHGFRRGTYDEE